MKNAAQKKQILSTPGFVTKSSGYEIKKTFLQSESKKTKTKIVFRARNKKALEVIFRYIIYKFILNREIKDSGRVVSTCRVRP